MRCLSPPRIPCLRRPCYPGPSVPPERPDWRVYQKGCEERHRHRPLAGLLVGEGLVLTGYLVSCGRPQGCASAVRRVAGLWHLGRSSTGSPQSGPPKSAALRLSISRWDVQPDHRRRATCMEKRLVRRAVVTAAAAVTVGVSSAACASVTASVLPAASSPGWRI